MPDIPTRPISEIEHEIAILEESLRTDWCSTLTWPRLQAVRDELARAKILRDAYGDPGIVGIRVW